MRLSSIGDVVHTLPARAALEQAGHRVSWLVEPAAQPLLDGGSVRVFPLPKARAFSISAARTTLGALRAERHDVALDFQGLWKSAGWARLSGAARTVGFAAKFRREPPSSLLLGERVEQPAEAVHVIDKNLALLRSVGIDAIGARAFPLPTDARASERVTAELKQRGVGDFVVLNPGGGWANKLWPAERFGALGAPLRARGLTPLVSFGPGEEALADRVVAASNGTVERAFPTTLLELLELLRRARLLVAADTGPLHMACAIGTKVVGLYGPTDPARNGPFSASDIVVRKAPACAPCHKRACPRHDGIMATLDVAEVAAAIERRLA